MVEPAASETANGPEGGALRTEWRGGTLLLTIDRPARRNAVDMSILAGLRGAQATAIEGRARVIVLTGAPPAFCAGADLTGVDSGDFYAALIGVLRAFTSLPIPVVAAIDGPALGAGAQLAAVADLRVATASSTLGVPAAKLGLAVDHFTVERLVREFGSPAARAMLLASQTYTAAQLHALGAIHRLGDLDDALAWADEIAGLAPLTITAHKVALESSAAPPDLDALVEAARAAAWASEDADEGRRAFLEKRRAVFRGH